MKRILAVAGFFAMVLMLPALSSAQVTSDATLSVSATVASSISMVLDTDTTNGGVALTGSGTNAATLAFGDISAFGTISTSGVTRGAVAVESDTNYTVSSPFDVYVAEANDPSSGGYDLTAQLGTADSTNTWKIDGTQVTDTGTISISTGASYGTDVSHTLSLTVPMSEATGSVTNSISLIATAN